MELLQTQGGHKTQRLIHKLINAANYSGLMLPPWAKVMHVGTRDAKKNGVMLSAGALSRLQEGAESPLSVPRSPSAAPCQGSIVAEGFLGTVLRFS